MSFAGASPPGSPPGSPPRTPVDLTEALTASPRCKSKIPFEAMTVVGTPIIFQVRVATHLPKNSLIVSPGMPPKYSISIQQYISPDLKSSEVTLGSRFTAPLMAGFSLDQPLTSEGRYTLFALQILRNHNLYTQEKTDPTPLTDPEDSSTLCYDMERLRLQGSGLRLDISADGRKLNPSLYEDQSHHLRIRDKMNAFFSSTASADPGIRDDSGQEDESSISGSA